MDADLDLELRVGGPGASDCKAGQRDGRTPVGGARPSRWWGAQAANLSAKEATTGALYSRGYGMCENQRARTTVMTAPAKYSTRPIPARHR